MQLKHINHFRHKPLHSQNMQHPECFMQYKIVPNSYYFHGFQNTVLPNPPRFHRFFLWVFSTQMSIPLRGSDVHLYLDCCVGSALLFVCLLAGRPYTSVTVVSIDHLMIFLGIRASLDDSSKRTGNTHRLSALLIIHNLNLCPYTLWIF